MARFLALDADAAGLFVVLATPKGGGALAIEQTVALADDSPPLTLASAPAQGAKLKDLLKQLGIRSAPLLVCVGRDRVILKDISYPVTAPADEPLVVRYQAIRDLTEAPDDVLMDYAPSTRYTPSGDKRATAVFIRKEVVQAARVLCDVAGLKLAAVTPRPYAVAASLQHAFTTGAAVAPGDPTDTIAIVSVWDGGGEFTVVRGPELTFTRTIPPQSTHSEAALGAEIRRNLAVYSGQNPDEPVEVLYLAEGDDPTDSRVIRLRTTLGIPVHSFDPVAGHPAADLIPPPLRGRFAGPVGLLAARSVSSLLPINFTQPRQPRSEPTKARPRILIGALLGLLLVAMVGVYAYLQISRVSRIKADRIAERDDLDTQLATMEPNQKRLAAADEFTRREVNVLDQFYDVAEMIPDVSKASVTEFHVNALPPPRKENTRAGASASAAAAAAAKNAPPPAVGSVRIVLRSTNDTVAQRIIDQMKIDKVYLNTAKSNSALAGAAGALGQQYVVTAQVQHRDPDKFYRTIKARPPESVSVPAPKSTPAASPTPAPAEFIIIEGPGGPNQ